MSDSPFLDTCWGKPVSHTPVWYMRQAGRCLPEYRELRKKYDILTLTRTPELAAAVSLMPVKRFGVDAAVLFADIMLPLIAMGVRLDIVEAIGPVIQHPIRTAADVNNLGRLNPEKDMSYLGKTISLIRKECPMPLIGFSAAPFTLASYLVEGRPSRDFQKIKKLMYNEQTIWNSLMRVLTDAIIIYLRYQVTAGVQALQIFDSWVGCLGRDDYIKYVLPYSREIFTALADSKVPRIHFATNTAAFLEEFASVDCEVISVDWRVPLDVVRKRIGRDKVLQGNFDPTLLLGDFSLAKEGADAIFTALSGSPSMPPRDFIFNLGHGVLPDTPYENLVRLTDYVHGK